MNDNGTETRYPGVATQRRAKRLNANRLWISRLRAAGIEQGDSNLHTGFRSACAGGDVVELELISESPTRRIAVRFMLVLAATVASRNPQLDPASSNRRWR